MPSLAAIRKSVRRHTVAAHGKGRSVHLAHKASLAASKTAAIRRRKERAALKAALKAEERMIRAGQRLEDGEERKRVRALEKEASKVKTAAARAYTKTVLKRLKARSTKALKASRKASKKQLMRVHKSLKKLSHS